MKLVGRIPVEPLDDERLTNIERRIVAGASDQLATPARARRPYLGFAAATFAAAAAGFVGWKLHRDPAPATATAATKVAMHTDRQKSVLDIGDATIESRPNTTFGITRPDGGVLVEMTRGRIELEVAKRAGRAPLIVRAGATDVIVVGTHFIVDCGASCEGEVDVRVTEGVVRVVRNAQDTR
ncbi:MAG: FecR domain-containing protein, partial [Deltaproteobacteria bacterium]|nr:FecR domain-containing protein [Deltaproteobacteria bacterium]